MKNPRAKFNWLSWPSINSMSYQVFITFIIQFPLWKLITFYVIDMLHHSRLYIFCIHVWKLITVYVVDTLLSFKIKNILYSCLQTFWYSAGYCNQSEIGCAAYGGFQCILPTQKSFRLMVNQKTNLDCDCHFHNFNPNSNFEYLPLLNIWKIRIWLIQI